MARIDKIKEEIGWLKVIFAISIATNISLIAWLIQTRPRDETRGYVEKTLDFYAEMWYN